MAIYHHVTTPLPAAPFRGPLHRARLLLARVIAWDDARQSRRSLCRLSARELEDIGLGRGDLDALVARR